jgi:diadenosine tetraphosphate (Ap4A) HIT family hydrolase
MNDANYPWFILVPRREGIREIHELPEADQQQLLRESSALARAMTEAFPGGKLNIAALGNVVPQLHLHHIARSATDPAWPAPAWGRVPARPYSPAERDGVVARLKTGLAAGVEWDA